MLTVMRLPLAFLIVACHANILMFPIMRGDAMILYDYSIIKYPIHLFAQVLFTSAVPIFFIISGFLFFYGIDTFSSKTYFAKIKKRIKTLLVPYLIWNIIYWIEPIMSMILKGGEIKILWLLESLWILPNQETLINSMSLTTPADPPLWFVRDLMVCMLVSPLFYWIIKIKKLGILLLFSLLIIWVFSPYQYPFPGLSICSLFFFFIGCFIAIRKVNLTTFLDNRNTFIIILTLYALCIFLELVSFDYVYNGYTLNLKHNHFIFSACTLLGCVGFPVIIFKAIKDKKVSSKYLGGGILHFCNALVDFRFDKDTLCKSASN